ncbi:MAG: ATP-dependent zinc metalloprotease FtsH [Clostridia bacterium]|nr:ATP-dependent zinc metalloprotease FtsH [Clostridia bacterium]
MDNKKTVRNLLIYLGIPIVLIIVISLFFSMQPKTEYATSEIVYMFKDQQVKEYSLDFGSGEINIKKIDDTELKTNVASITLFLQSVNPYIEEYNEKNPDHPMKYTWKQATDNSWWLSLIPNLILIVLLGVVWWYFMRKLSGSMGDAGKQMNFGKAKIKSVNDEKRKTTFADVAGADEEKEELREIVEFLKDPKKYNELGARIPKGVLLVGPPGTGKTLLARAVAGEAGVQFFSISGSDFVEMFVGVGASRVRDLFEQAKKNSPCIIFIDEIDAVGRQRGAGLGGGHDEREQTLNQLLVEMDGFGANEGVIMIAATNRPDILDPALMRPGRFDRQVIVGRPDIKGREEILRVHAKGKPLAPDVDLKTIAKSTAGFTGADLENLLNEAALLAARKDLKAITMEQVEEATIKVVAGTEKKSRVMSDKEKKLTAYHEAGHAVATYFCPTQDPVHQISIIPRGMAGGYTMSLPSEDKSYRSRKEMLEEIVVLLGGRVAEALILGDISTGASNDIERATNLVFSMITKYGMSEKLGPITYGSSDDEVFLGKGINNNKNYSEETAAAIDEEVKKYITAGYNKTEEILKEHTLELHKVAQFLFENEKMSGEQFECVMEGKSVKNDDDETSENLVDEKENTDSSDSE